MSRQIFNSNQTGVKVDCLLLLFFFSYQLLLAYFAYTWEVPSYDHPAALGYVFMGIPLVMIVLGMIAAVITWGILPSQVSQAR